MKQFDPDVIINFLDYISMSKDIHLVRDGKVIPRDECQKMAQNYIDDLKWKFIESICVKLNPNFYLLPQSEQAHKRNEISLIYKLFKKEKE